MIVMLKRILTGVAVAVMLAGSAVAGPVEDGIAAENNGDYAQAVKFYRLAADEGIASAQYNLGNMYAQGKGVPQDYSEAIAWYRLAADQGFAYSQHNLGVAYANGKGVPQDIVLAHMWFNLSAAQGEETAVKGRDIVARDMTPDQLAEAQRMAREWKPSPRP